MKCKIHPYDQSGGVCASCLRNRLLDLKTSQDFPSPDLRRRHPPPPSLFQRSASPRRLSSSSETSSVVSDRRRRFHRTPQILDDRRESPGCQRFSLSWFYSLIHRRSRKKKKNNTEMLKVSPPPLRRRSCTVSDRGMSPQDDVSEGGYSTESTCATWRRETQSRRATAETRRHHGGGFYGFTVCLNPLVGPTCQRDAGFSGELNRHVVGGGVSFGANRSRKLADRSRFR